MPAPANPLPISLTVGTAGHIDHGKSALIEALTGTHPDRLAEEQRRGITIDLGFAHLGLSAADGRRVQIGFIDVPGHERFVRNMLAGAGGIELVLLVVAADEGVKPQTREHFQICRLLGIERGIVALTKCDLADAETRTLAAAEIADLVRGSFLEGAPVIPVSAKTGAGLEELRQALAAAAVKVKGRASMGPARLPLDRVFSLRGFGTVVTGTLLAGQIAVESELEVLAPRGLRRLRVRGVQVHGQPVERALAGQRTAINLAGVEPAALARGLVLAEPGVFRCSARLTVDLELLVSAPPLKSGAPLHLHALSAETVARVTLFDAPRLASGSRGLARLRLAEPLPLIPGDRFIVRQFSPLTTIGGGRVLATDALRLPANDAPARAQALARLAAAGAEEHLQLWLEAAGLDGLTPAALGLALGRRAAEVAADLARLEAAGRVVLAGSAALSRAAAQAWEQAILAALAAFHAGERLVPAIGADTLRGRLQPARLRRPEQALVYRAILQKLIAAGRVETAGEGVRLPGQGPRLDAGESEARQRIEAAFRAAGLRAPAVDSVLAQCRVESRRAAQLLQLLLRDGSLIKINEELILHRAALEELRRSLAERKKTAPRLSVPAFKQLTGVTRKYAIPLLEYLDRVHVTRRVGDDREIL
ncbi:MAG TPA: selenocysteine-specific translation elongation factor [Terriglobales bacterium]|nr:selenocysteine-specific translation elongation factor [Terriglobales bacterium]